MSISARARKGIALGVALTALLAASASQAGGYPKAHYPPHWQSWPVLKQGRIPPKGADLPADLPAIVRQTFKTYSWINEGRGSSYTIRIDPDKKGTHDYGTGPTAVFHIHKIGVLLVTGHLRGISVYGVYTDSGKDISGSHPSLRVRVCRGCHASHGQHTSGRFGCTKGICSQ